MKNNIIVTTTDLPEDYEVIGPVYFHVSNQGFFTSTLSQLIDKYNAELEELQNNNQPSSNIIWMQKFGGQSMDSDSRVDKAFYAAIRELQEMVAEMGGDAIVGLRQSINFAPQNPQQFNLQVYGTAVRFDS